ncbi:MAG: T9SS type A sorting domain-containing protein [Salibacteraceae bacterium]
MKTPSLISLLLFFFCQATAQDWKVIGEFNSGVDCLYADEKSDLLYIGGAFETVDGKTCYGVATWNGQQWGGLGYGVNYDTIPNTWGGGVSQITNYDDQLIVVGSFSHVGYFQKSRNVAIWNTDSLKWKTVDWKAEPLGSFDFVHDAGDTTFVLGTYDSIGGIASMGVNYLYQSRWSNMSPPDGAEIPKVLVSYQGSYYLGGNMNGSIPGANDIARWDGVKFHPVGTGVSGGLGHVHDMIVYKDELYIGGSFTISTGHTGDYIMKWDGKQYHNVGNANWVVFDLEIHKGILYAAGIFDTINGVACNGIAWYDGENWNEIEYNHTKQITDIVFHNDTLYGQRNNGGKHEVLRYNGSLPNSIHGLPPKNSQYLVYPNPSSTTISIKGLLPTDQYQITNLQGKILLLGKSPEINTTTLNSGIYFVHIFSKHLTYTLKFIKQ